MLDINLLRKNPAAVVAALARRGVAFDLEAFQVLETRRKAIQSETESLQAERNALAARVGALKRQGAGADALELETAFTRARTVAGRLEALGSDLQDVQTQLAAVLMRTPNLPHESVPDGVDETGNQCVAQWGVPRVFDFTVRDHVSVGESLGGLDLAAGAKLAGARFAVLQAGVARLHRALAQFMLDVHTTEHGYTEVWVPYLVNRASMQGTGQLPKFEEDLFRVPREGDDTEPFYLIPTAEVPVTNLVRDMVLAETALPLKWVAHTPCFRSEAGAAGRDTRGLVRQHQFDKVELVQVVRPEDSAAALDALRWHAESILQRLGLPYRTMLLCAGDMGFGATKTFDLEVWLPGQSTYREISSCSTFGDFQARRLSARMKRAGGKPELVHTLNGSGLAVGRTLVAVLENYQQADGSVLVPEVLRPYMGGLERLGG